MGIPYLPMKDPNVVEKMRFIEHNSSKAASDQWYMRQTFKGLNQTIGRIIRNKNDYGVILLVDQRYEREDALKEFSPWFIKSLRKSPTEEDLMLRITHFLKE